ncbi:MAG TPA: elongation factor G [Alphaproteobacteria bacterium]|nr:elongation factor G [Alphaproteobacteria bacterium]
MTDRGASGPRAVAFVGPYLSGKTTLLESILSVTGAVGRKGSVAEGNTVGDSSPEARARKMGIEVNVATARYLDDSFTFLDCPGSIEFFQESRNALIGVDAAVVVIEPDVSKILSLAPLLNYLDEIDMPRLLFVNKLDKAQGPVSDLLDALQQISRKPLVLRQLPTREGDRLTGYVDLASERAYVYKVNAPSALVDLPEDLATLEQEARFHMLEQLADFDDHLMEELLEDVEPPKDEIFTDLAEDLQEGRIVPVLLGCAEKDNGVRRLLKALRHEVPGFEQTVSRVGVDKIKGDAVAQVLKTYHTPHGGKLSVARVYRGTIEDGDTLNDERVSGVYHMTGMQTEKAAKAGAGDVVALGRLEGVKTGDTLIGGKGASGRAPRTSVLPPVYGLVVDTASRGDEVKLTSALSKIADEDPSISYEQNPDTHQLVLWGQGEMHLKVAVDKLQNKYGLKVTTDWPSVPYKEAIRKPATQRGRFKRQSGGHGQFGDVVLDIKPLPRGSGFSFDDTITGGVVPKQYIPSVETGVKEYLSRGPLGFPVVDVAVTLTDGSFHSVDSSDMAFKQAGRLAMQEALPNCSPVLLEPIMSVHIMVPSEFTSKANGLVSGRRGQLLGFDAREGWPGWDEVQALIPQAELQNIIIELRSLTQGSGTFTFEFDHLAELTGRLADDVLVVRRTELGTS